MLTGRFPEYPEMEKAAPEQLAALYLQRILDCNHDAIGQPAGRQRPARKIGGGATTCKRGGSHEGRGGAHP